MPPPEPPETTLGQLALRVLRQNASAFLDHSAGVAENDSRAVHQTRVATRRLRAALRLFHDVLPSEASSLHEELTWIASELGPARDLDVQVNRLRENAVELGVADALVPYAAWLEGQRQRAQRELDDALKSVRFQNLADRLHGLQDWAANPAADAALDTEGPRRLRRVFRTLKKLAERIGPDSPFTDLHRVRIRTKRLRYAAEFFELAYGKPAQRLVELTVVVQDLLGDLQDAAVSSQHIRQAMQTSAGSWPAETCFAMGQLIQHDAQRAAHVRERFPSAYEELKGRAWKRLASRFAMS